MLPAKADPLGCRPLPWPWAAWAGRLCPSLGPVFTFCALLYLLFLTRPSPTQKQWGGRGEWMWPLFTQSCPVFLEPGSL